MMSDLLRPPAAYANTIPARQSPVAGCVPYAPDPFWVGRWEYLMDAWRIFTNFSVTETVLTGMVGTGKTALATEIAWRFSRPPYFDTIRWYSLTDDGASLRLAQQNGSIPVPLERMSDQIRLISQGIPRAEGHGKQRILVVLDGIESAEQLATIIPQDRSLNSTYIHVLVTTRDTACAGNMSRAVVPLSSFTPDESLALLAQRCSEPLEEPAAEQLSAILGHLPLAVARSAAWLDEHRATQTITAYLEQMCAMGVLNHPSQTATILDSPTNNALPLQTHFDRIYHRLQAEPTERGQRAGQVVQDACWYLNDAAGLAIPEEGQMLTGARRHLGIMRLRQVGLLEYHHDDTWHVPALLKHWLRHRAC